MSGCKKLFLLGSIILLLLFSSPRNAKAQWAPCSKPQLLIILDKSCSMGGYKWSSAVNAIRTLTNSYRNKLFFGLEVFDSGARIIYGIDTCMRDGSRCVGNLQSALSRVGPSGGTSLIAAINVGRSHLSTVRSRDSIKNRKRSVLFITDGKASCANSQVRALRQQLGVKTYVIGFGGGVDANCLNQMAIEGGDPLPGARKYYQADNSSELQNAMNKIANSALQEVCNGLDDDCDGRIDETFPGMGASCTTNRPGRCRAGRKACVRGQIVCKSIYSPTIERCNRVDDDCDGQVDESFPENGRPCNTGRKGICARGVYRCNWGRLTCQQTVFPRGEVCNGLDDNCDGRIDETFPGKGSPCNTGRSGICSKGNLQCVRGRKTCVPNVPPRAESCNGIDDDCDGQIDETFPQYNRPCNTGKMGICSRGALRCRNAKIYCHQITFPKPETCNGKDDDCDGQVDETFPEKGRSCRTGKPGICSPGFYTCPNGRLFCKPKSNPQAESCNGKDDDCDGQVDEDWPLKGKPCTNGVGGCKTKGKYICKKDGSGVTCSAPPKSPKPEVCNGEDDDCDGQIDENLTRPCSTACGKGLETCKKGAWVNCTAPKPQTETCNGKDDDCDGQIDENLTRPCSTICGKGTETCKNGAWVNCTAPKPQTETCNGKDDDCDGKIDELPPKPCLDKCGYGKTQCLNGQWSSCQGAPQPKPEVCNGKDDDCDGLIDENLVKKCSTDCGDGRQVCVKGKWSLCNAPKVKPEVCNGKDDDCDGKVDNSAHCPTGMTCRNGQCFDPCKNSECPFGQQCINGLCEPKKGTDLCKNVKCSKGEVCLHGKCIDACALVKCDKGYVCKEGKCVADNCYAKGCPKGQTCIDGKCKGDPCLGVQCGPDQFCRFGQCVSSCAGVKCPAGEVCKSGRCVKDPKQSPSCKNVTCKKGEYCANGTCIADPCYGITCDAGQKCIDGFCSHDPCLNIKCPKGQFCADGQCYGKGSNGGTTYPDGRYDPPPDSGTTLPDGGTALPDGGQGPVRDGGTTLPDGRYIPPEESASGKGPSQSGDSDSSQTDGGAPESGVSADSKAGIASKDTDAQVNNPPNGSSVRRYSPGCACNNTPAGSLPFLLLLLFALLPVFRRKH